MRVLRRYSSCAPGLLMVPPPHGDAMTESNASVARLAASGREIIPEDVEPLWLDFMDGRATAEETATRAELLMETVNVIHVANWGLSSLYHLTYRGEPCSGDIEAAFESWRRQVREYRAEPEAWDRRHYQRMLRDFAERYGAERARAFGVRLVSAGEMHDADVDDVLGQPAAELRPLVGR